MKNIFTESLQKADEYGVRFSIDFEKRSFKLNGKYVIENGKYEGETGLAPCSSTQEFLSRVESLYERYRHSRPSERSESKRKRYFIPLPEEKLSDEDMYFGIVRDVAQLELELFILLQILMGFKWDESMGSWFWQSSKNNNLVLLRRWVEPQNNRR